MVIIHFDKLSCVSVNASFTAFKMFYTQRKILQNIFTKKSNFSKKNIHGFRKIAARAVE
jgi:hypothetical protein